MYFIFASFFFKFENIFYIIKYILVFNIGFTNEKEKNSALQEQFCTCILLYIFPNVTKVLPIYRKTVLLAPNDFNTRIHLTMCRPYWGR